MAKVFDAVDYKFSKIVAGDLKKVMAILDRAIKDLAPYSRYTYAVKAMAELRAHRVVVKAQMEYHEKVQAKKGIVGD